MEGLLARDLAAHHPLRRAKVGTEGAEARARLDQIRREAQAEAAIAKLEKHGV